MKGEIRNWREVGGDDRPIRVVAVNEGGGTVAAVRAAIPGTAPITPDAVRLESAKHVLKVIAQEPGAIGIAQLGLVHAARLNEIVTEQIIEQPLSYVTLGDPAPGVQRFITATRAAVSNARD